MAYLGKFNTLTVRHEAGPGFYLDGLEHGDILLPGKYRTPDLVPGAEVNVFVYRDSEDRLIATTETPHAVVDQFAFLRVVSVNPRIGAFLDWGLDKDLLLPIREWPGPVHPGEWHVVKVSIDPRTDRIVASGRLPRHLNKTPANYIPGQAVKLLIANETPLGYHAIINHAHSGLLYASDVPEPLGVGQLLDGFVLRQRPDGKVDLTLHQAGFEKIAPLTKKILNALAAPEAKGRLPLHDGSAPADIRAALGVSKKAFKAAIGQLFRDRKIVIEDTGIRLPGPVKK